MKMEFPGNRRTFIKKSAAFLGGFAVLFAVGKSNSRQTKTGLTATGSIPPRVSLNGAYQEIL